ncbi:MAG: hypothetical protein CNLJKLNK_01034 [Holosporales bacterium]
MKNLSSFIFSSLAFLLAHQASASGVSAPNIPAPQAASDQGNHPNNMQTPQPIPSGAQPIAGSPPSNNGVISYPVPQSLTGAAPAITGATPPAAPAAVTNVPKQPTKKVEPLVSPALEQELATKGLEAKQLYAVIENNKIYLVGPKKSAHSPKKGKPKRR